mmetsp:Transcript_124637/g.363973  ORF Transcript_124637/g.363973 Transcript_124637/m.363973 type:complete len:108 (+) Transcript_124637:297-620(+)
MPSRSPSGTETERTRNNAKKVNRQSTLNAGAQRHMGIDDTSALGMPRNMQACTKESSCLNKQLANSSKALLFTARLLSSCQPLSLLQQLLTCTRLLLQLPLELHIQV